MQARQPEMILRPVDGDVLVAELIKGRHQFLEVCLAANIAHVRRGEIGVHAGTVPVQRLLEGRQNGLTTPFNIDAVSLRQAREDITGHPHLVSGALGAFAKNLEFPLTLRHFGIDAFEINAGIETDIDVLLDDFARHITDIFVTYAGIIRTLRSRIAIHREAQGATVLVEEIFLLKAKPSPGIIRNRGPRIRRMRHARMQESFAHHEHPIDPGAIRENCDGFQGDI